MKIVLLPHYNKKNARECSQASTTSSGPFQNLSYLSVMETTLFTTLQYLDGIRRLLALGR